MLNDEEVEISVYSPGSDDDEASNGDLADHMPLTPFRYPFNLEETHKFDEMVGDYRLNGSSTAAGLPGRSIDYNGLCRAWNDIIDLSEGGHIQQANTCIFRKIVANFESHSKEIARRANSRITTAAIAEQSKLLKTNLRCTRDNHPLPKRPTPVPAKRRCMTVALVPSASQSHVSNLTAMATTNPPATAAATSPKIRICQTCGHNNNGSNHWKQYHIGKKV